MGKKRKNRWLLEKVSQARRQGISVDVNGVLYQDKNREELSLVMQKGTYMLDYEGDFLGNIVALHVDRIDSPK